MGEESYPMKGGDSTFSYAKNSTLQSAASRIAKGMICESITENLNLECFLTPTSARAGAGAGRPTIRIADLGCSIGPNAFTAMQNVIDTVETKCKTLHVQPQFQVFFSDHTGNDFNTLFTSLPSDRTYFSAGVPGSFYGRLFPDESLHLIHSSYALQWLSKPPEELLANDSPSWNGDRIHYTCAPPGVAQAYARQYSEDMELFLETRAQELVVGGMMLLIVPCIPHDTMPHSQVPAGVMFDLLGASLFNMAEEGRIDHAQVASFNLPIYAVSPTEMEKLVVKNGRFSIERMELTDPSSGPKKENDSGGENPIARHLRAGMEGILSKHFGAEIMDELFDRFSQKIMESSERFSSCQRAGTQLFIALVKQK